MEKCVEDWIQNRYHLVNVLCHGVIEGNSKIRPCIFDILISKCGVLKIRTSSLNSVEVGRS